jgi:UDPglucose 6-dehydrogenase
MQSASTKPRLSVIGLGKLGSPMAAVFATKGFTVVGLDYNAGFVDALNKGIAPVVEPQLQDHIDRGRANLRATTDYTDATHATDVSFIIVPTPSGPDKMFVNKFVIDAVEKIGAALKTKDGYHVVVITSTVMPGTTESVIKDALEASSGRKVGVDVGLCYNPEFIALGSVVRDMLNPDMLLIGESDARAGDMLESIYRGSTDSNPEYQRMNLVNAELCKISVNTYVTTKISYANMIADMCDHLPGADADVVTRAVGADSRVGKKYLKPAIGYGGPCFPRDNKAFSAFGRKLGVNTALAEATDAINEHQFQRMIGAVEASAEPGASITILGMSYKPHTAVIEESQGVYLAKYLIEKGYSVSISDPMATEAAIAVLGSTVNATPMAQDAVSHADVVVITTPWAEFKSVDWSKDVAAGKTRVVIDPWGITPETVGVGARVVKLGSGNWKKL